MIFGGFRPRGRKVALFNTSGSEVEIDGSTLALETIEHVHHEIHNGRHFYIKDFANIASAGSVNFLFKVANTTRWPHFFFKISFEKESTITLRRVVSVSGSGTEVASFNSNENSSNTAGMKVYQDPTGLVSGSVLQTFRKGDGKNAGGEVRNDDEIELGQALLYNVSIENHGVPATSLTDYNFSWYEHTDKS